jgi:nucleotide-binding universal stress UspA family protein
MSHSLPVILAAIDYSEQSASVVEEAVSVARRSRPCELHFLHVNHARAPSEDEQEGRRSELLEWLGARLPEQTEVLESVVLVAHEVSGDPAQLIVRTASELSADLVIVGTHGRKGLERMVLGSVAEAVSRRCGCSVQVIRSKRHDSVEDSACSLCVNARLESGGVVQFCKDHAARSPRRQATYDRGVARWVRHSLGR